MAGGDEVCVPWLGLGLPNRVRVRVRVRVRDRVSARVDLVGGDEVRVPADEEGERQEHLVGVRARVRVGVRARVRVRVRVRAKARRGRRA